MKKLKKKKGGGVNVVDGSLLFTFIIHFSRACCWCIRRRRRSSLLIWATPPFAIPTVFVLLVPPLPKLFVFAVGFFLFCYDFFFSFACIPL